MSPSPDVRRIAIELAALAQTGLTYCEDPYEIERLHRVGELGHQLMELVADGPLPPYERGVVAAGGYATPKVDVRGALFDADGRVLLVRELKDDGRWTLPGGWCDVLDTPRAAVEREIREEAGVEARAVHLAAVCDREVWGHTPPFDVHVYKLFFVCEALGDVDPSYVSAETGGLGWFDPDDLPELSVDRVLPEQIRLLRDHWRNPTAAHVD